MPGWLRIDRKAFADGALERTECLWLNPVLADRAGARSLLDAMTA